MRKAASALDYRELARRRMPPFLFEYLDGGSYAQVTLGRNISDLEQVVLRQRVLDGDPGVQSARYLRPDASYDERFREIYQRLQARKVTASAARFVCALSMADQDRILFETTGSVEGDLAPAPAGDGGFGYDPIFYAPPYGKTFGQVSPREKTAVSHRGKAIRALRDYLQRT